MEEDAPDLEINKDKKSSDPKQPTYTSSDTIQSEPTFTVPCGCPDIDVATVVISSGWDHAQEGHPEVKKEHLINAISKPITVRADRTRAVGTSYVFQGSDTPRPDSKSKIHVCVKIVSASKTALLSTAYYMRKPPNGEIVWTREKNAEKEE